MTTELRNEEVYAVVKEDSILTRTALRYLNIYVGKASWEHEIEICYKKHKAKIGNQPGIMKQILCCTILLPAFDRSVKPDPAHPENLLHRVPYFQQLPDYDWFYRFKEIFRQDVAIDDNRKRALAMGVIHPFEYAPTPRQAYNWLYERAEHAGVLTSEDVKQDISERFKNLVEAYGGAVICSLFSRHEDAVKKVLNWRTGYFFERALNDVYTIEDIVKIKDAELKKTNSNLVKTVKFI